MGSTNSEVWIATADDRDMVRADAIVVVRFDGVGRITAQLHDEAKVTVTLVNDASDAKMPSDFHRQLIRAIAELADSSGAKLVKPQRDDRGWHWMTEPL